jgi:hypothetical protein
MLRGSLQARNLSCAEGQAEEICHTRDVSKTCPPTVFSMSLTGQAFVSSRDGCAARYNTSTRTYLEAWHERLTHRGEKQFSGLCSAHIRWLPTAARCPVSLISRSEAPPRRAAGSRALAGMSPRKSSSSESNLNKSKPKKATLSSRLEIISDILSGVEKIAEKSKVPGLGLAVTSVKLIVDTVKVGPFISL